MAKNLDEATVAGFGREWQLYDHSNADVNELGALFDRYFRIFPWSDLSEDAEGFDLGCGTGRWARFVAPRVGQLHCIDASDRALEVARRNLQHLDTCVFHHASVGDLPLDAESMDFGYSIGVLHHVPNTEAGIQSCVRLLKPKAPLLLYLFYAFDNQPVWYKAVWRASELLRSAVSRMPFALKKQISFLLAVVVYWPLARIARELARRGVNVGSFPLSTYRDTSFYVMCTDALDRFGTRLTHRFTREEIETMMKTAGLDNVQFSHAPPFWCAVGFRK